MGKSKDWVVWCRSRKQDEKQHPFEVDGKEICSNRSKQAKPKAGEKTDKTGGKGQLARWKAWWRQGNIKCAVSGRVCLVLGSSRLPCGRRAKSSVEESGRSIRRKRRASSAIERERIRLLDGHRDRHAWRLWVSGQSNGR